MRMSFEVDDIKDGFEPVAGRIGKQNRTIKDFSSFMQKRAEIEESYAKRYLYNSF